ncbi:MAG: glucose-6-phosphate dehydrogenase, partial [Rhodobacteraceae bacterium]|nr:glucose-6-phosphate dehydrogenase [Paracoccaceae bacterium]
MVARVIPVEPFDLVVFGATGDLARRKILPALYRRFAEGQMPPEARVIGAARTPLTRAEFHAVIAAAFDEFMGADAPPPADRAGFFERLDYVTVDARREDGWLDLAARMRDDVVRAFYFSVGPSLFGPLATGLGRFGLVTPDTRIVVEKPFGNDLGTARALNQTLAEHFTETQIYRIDH